MSCARLAFAAFAVVSLAMAGCQSVGTATPGTSQGLLSKSPLLSPSTPASSRVVEVTSEYPAQQVGYNAPLGSNGGSSCGCSSCQTKSSCSSCGNNCGGRCGSRSGGSRSGGRFCGCGGQSFSIFGSPNCARCGGLRGGQCGRCGVFGIFNGRCGGCGNGGTPHTEPFMGPAGPLSGTYAYPYYTIRGPRDFFMANPPSLGR